jgi:hypothetical protein
MMSRLLEIFHCNECRFYNELGEDEEGVCEEPSQEYKSVGTGSGFSETCPLQKTKPRRFLRFEDLKEDGYYWCLPREPVKGEASEWFIIFWRVGEVQSFKDEIYIGPLHPLDGLSQYNFWEERKDGKD